MQPNPGTAIQDDYNTELNPVITLEPGQKETTAQVQTKRNKNKTGDQYFTAEITDVSEGAILGFNKRQNQHQRYGKQRRLIGCTCKGM